MNGEGGCKGCRMEGDRLDIIAFEIVIDDTNFKVNKSILGPLSYAVDFQAQDRRAGPIQRQRSPLPMLL